MDNDDVILKAACDLSTKFTECFTTEAFRAKITEISKVFTQCLKHGGKILVAGNGGSHCSALHFAEELTGRFRKDRPALGAIALGEATHASCVSNDYGPEYVFDRQVAALGRSGDILLFLSTSGMSKNLTQTILWATERKLTTVALLGKGGGFLGELVNYGVTFPGETSDRIQELHVFTLHVLVELIERELFPHLYQEVQ